MQKNQSTAYDYSRFETTKKKKEPSIKEVAIKRPHTHKGGLLKTVFYLCIAIAMVGSLLYCKAMQVQIESEYTQTMKEINSLKSENTSLQIELESKLSLKNIELIAQNDLGLEKIDDQKIEYINFNEYDKVEVLQEKGLWNKIIDTVKDFFS